MDDFSRKGGAPRLTGGECPGSKPNAARDERGAPRRSTPFVQSTAPLLPGRSRSGAVGGKRMAFARTRCMSRGAARGLLAAPGQKPQPPQRAVMTTEPHPMDPERTTPVGGGRYVTDANKPESAIRSSPQPTPTIPGDDSCCGTPPGKPGTKPGTSNAGSSPAPPPPPPPGAPGPQRTPVPTPADPNQRPTPPGPPPPPLPKPQPPGRPKGQDADQRPLSTQPRSLPESRGLSERPGGNVQTDSSGKTYEGNTGVSGETAEDEGH